MLGDAAQYVGNTIGNTCPLTTPDTEHTIMQITQRVDISVLLKTLKASERKFTVCRLEIQRLYQTT